MHAFQDLLTGPSTNQVPSELLEVLGRKAANMFTQQGVSLNDSISKLVAEHPQLTNEHIKRVVEFANNTAFQEMFEQGQDKNVHFPVADPGVVIRDMRDGGSPAHDGKALMEGGKKDFMSPPPSGNGAQGDAQLSELFAYPGQGVGTDPMMKNASEETVEVPHAQHANPVEDVYDAHVTLQATRDRLAIENGAQLELLKQAHRDFVSAVRYEVISPDGAGLGGVCAVLEKIGAAKTASNSIQDITRGLLAEGVLAQRLEQSLTKTAGVVVNPNHPVVVSWRELEKAAEESLRVRSALADAEKGLAETTAFLRRSH